MTTLLDDLRPLGAPGRKRPRARFLAWIPAALIVVTVLGSLWYRDHYEPLDHGGLGGLGGDSRLLTVNDGLQDTAYVITAAASPTTQTFSLVNNGHFDVKILSISDDDGGDVSLSVRRIGDGGDRAMEDVDSQRFHPFVLHADESRAMQLTISSARCTADDAGDVTWVTRVRVRYRFWGQTNQTWVPLEKPIYRSCPDGQLHPHVTAAPSSVVSRLVPTDYQFGVPKGWIAHPLTNAGGPSSVATWSQPQGPGRVTYEQNGGSAGMLYDDQDNIRLSGARDAAGCRLTAFHEIGGGAFDYACAAPKGLLRKGILRIASLASGGGYERIEILSADKALVAEFLDGIKA